MMSFFLASFEYSSMYQNLEMELNLYHNHCLVGIWFAFCTDILSLIRDKLQSPVAPKIQQPIHRGDPNAY